MKWTKMFFTLGLFLCIAGGGLFMVGKATGGSRYIEKGITNKDKSQKSQLQIMEKTKIDRFTKLTVDMKHLDLYIRKSENGNCYMEYVVEEKEGNNPLDWNTGEGMFSLKEQQGSTASYYREVKRGIAANLLGDYHTEEYENIVILYLPEDLKLESCSIVLDKGDLEATEISAKKLTWSLAEGDIFAKKLSVGEGTFIAEEGDVEIKRLFLQGNVEIESEDGDIFCRLDESCRDKIDISAHTQDGDIDVARRYGSKNRKTNGEYTRRVEGNACRLVLSTEEGNIEIK